MASVFFRRMLDRTKNCSGRLRNCIDRSAAYFRELSRVETVAGRNEKGSATESMSILFLPARFSTCLPAAAVFNPDSLIILYENEQKLRKEDYPGVNPFNSEGSP